MAIARRGEDGIPLDVFVASLDSPGAPVRVPGTADPHNPAQFRAFGARSEPKAQRRPTRAAGSAEGHPERAPRVVESARVTVEELSAGIRLELRFGFAENPMSRQALLAHLAEVECDPGTASFFLAREVPVPSLRPELPLWQERLYAFMVRNAVSAPDYFRIAS